MVYFRFYDTIAIVLYFLIEIGYSEAAISIIELPRLWCSFISAHKVHSIHPAVIVDKLS